jgi:glutamyl/glutaminyl-tRNA synthetase
MYPEVFNYYKPKFCHYNVVQSFQTAELTKRKARTPLEAGHDAFSRHPPPTQAPNQAGFLRATHHQRHYLEQQIITRLSILILSKTYPSG